MASATDAARASPSTLKANYGQEAYFKTDTVRVDNVSDRELEADVGRLFLVRVCNTVTARNKRTACLAE